LNIKYNKRSKHNKLLIGLSHEIRTIRLERLNALGDKKFKVDDSHCQLQTLLTPWPRHSS